MGALCAASPLVSTEFHGRVVAITNAASAIGRDLCWYFGRRGARIAPFDRTEQLRPFVEQLRSETIIVGPSVVDLGDAAAVARAFRHAVARLGPVDILVHEANANLDGTRNCTSAVLPDMQARSAGVIVNIACEADHDLVSLTHALAAEYGPFNIRANVVCLYPFGPTVEPAEVVRMVASLASDAAGAISGSMLRVDYRGTTGHVVMARESALG